MRRASYFLLVLCSGFLAAPGAAPDKNEWLPIPPEDLALKGNPASPGSHAMILFSETVHDLEKRFISYYVRTKIFDQDGLKFARMEVQQGSPLHRIEDFRARTIHPDGTIVDFSGEFVTESRLGPSHRYSVQVFSFPDVTPGSIVEYKYRLQTHLEGRPPRNAIYLRPGTKTNVRQLLTEPRFFDWPVQGALFSRKSEFSVHPRSANEFVTAVPDYRTDNLPAGTVVTSKQGHLLCEASNVPARVSEDFPPPKRELVGHIEMYFHEHQPETETQFWGRYAQALGEYEKQFLGSDKLTRRMVAEIVQPDDTPETKLRKLYLRTEAIRNIDFEPPQGPDQPKRPSLAESENVEDVLKHGSGSSDDINLTFLALALAAGFEASTAHLASRDIQSFDPQRLDLSQLNTTAVWVRLADAEIVLDPGTPFCPFGMLPWQKAFSGGIRLMKDGWKAVSTRAMRTQDSRIERSAELQLSPEGLLRGRMLIRFYGQEALELRLQNLGLSEEERADHLSTRILEWMPAGVSIEHLKVSGWDTGDGPLSADLQISVPTAPGPDRGVLLPLFLSVAGRRNPFENSTRDVPVRFRYPYEEVDQIRVALPLGMTWKRPLPRQGFTFEMPGMRISPPAESGAVTLRHRTPGEVTGAAFKSSSALLENSLIIKRALAVAAEVVPTSEYSKLRDFFARVWAADAEKAALRPAVAPPG